MSDFRSLDGVLSAAESEFLTTLVAQKGAAESLTILECISVTVQNGEVCINLPLGLGRECIDLPDWVPDGEVASVCLSIRRRWGVPVGVSVCVYVAGQEVACVYFGL